MNRAHVRRIQSDVTCLVKYVRLTQARVIIAYLLPCSQPVQRFGVAGSSYQTFLYVETVSIIRVYV